MPETENRKWPIDTRTIVCDHCGFERGRPCNWRRQGVDVDTACKLSSVARCWCCQQARRHRNRGRKVSRFLVARQDIKTSSSPQRPCSSTLTDVIHRTSTAAHPRCTDKCASAASFMNGFGLSAIDYSPPTRYMSTAGGWAAHARRRGSRFRHGTFFIRAFHSELFFLCCLKCGLRARLACQWLAIYSDTRDCIWTHSSGHTVKTVVLHFSVCNSVMREVFRRGQDLNRIQITYK